MEVSECQCGSVVMRMLHTMSRQIARLETALRASRQCSQSVDQNIVCNNSPAVVCNNGPEVVCNNGQWLKPRKWNSGRMAVRTPCSTDADDNGFWELSVDDGDEAGDCVPAAAVVVTPSLRRRRRKRRNRAHEESIEYSGSVEAPPSFEDLNTSLRDKVTKHEDVHEKGFDADNEARRINIVGSIRECFPMQAPEISSVDLDRKGDNYEYFGDVCVTCVLSMSGSFGPAELRDVCANYGRVRRIYAYRYGIGAFIACIEFEEPVAAGLFELNGKRLHGTTWFSVTAADFDEDISKAEGFFDMSRPGDYERLAEFKWGN